MTQTKPTAAPARLPLFFKELTVLDTVQHRALRFPVDRKAFPQAQGNVVPITVGEVGHVLRHYPIVFVEDSAGIAVVAVTGLEPGRNEFIDAAGRWRPGCYVPSFVRGYPFATLRPADGAEPILAFDATAPEFGADEGLPLFDVDGVPTHHLKNIAAFQNEFRLLAERTVECARALWQAGVLEPGQMQIRLPGQNGATQPARQIDGFLVVSEAKLRELPAETLKGLMQNGALGLAYAHLLSLSSLVNVVAPPTAAPTAPAEPTAPTAPTAPAAKKTRRSK